MIHSKKKHPCPFLVSTKDFSNLIHLCKLSICNFEPQPQHNKTHPARFSSYDFGLNLQFCSLLFLAQKISFKSYNGGRVDSEPEESPRSLNTTTLTSLNNLRAVSNHAHPHHAPCSSPNNNKQHDTLRRVDYSGNEYTSNELVVTPAANIIDPSKVILAAADIDYGRAEQLGTLTRAQQAERGGATPAHLLPHLLHHQIAAQHHYLTHGGRRKAAAGGYLRSASPWNHTYTEIRDGLGQLHQIRVPSEDDPVYEEIERNGNQLFHQEVQVSDMSDEDGRRQSDMSRQSSRSYSDHRPLIPYGQAANAAAAASVTLESLLRHNLKEQQQLDAELMRYRAAGRYLAAADANVRTVAFLEGETVVCHLQPEAVAAAAAELYNPYVGRTMVLSPYSEC